MGKIVQVIGDYSHTHKNSGIRTCFYYAEGNVIMIFDYTEDCIGYFLENSDLLKYAREIIFCYSQAKPVHIIKHSIDKLFDMIMTSLEKRYIIFGLINHGMIGYTRVGFNHDPIIEYNRCTFAFKTNSDTEICIRVGRCNMINHITYTIFRETSMWQPYLFYNGLAGEIDTANIYALMKNPGTRVMFYLNHEVMFGPENPSNGAVKQRLLNTMRDLNNKITLLGFRTEMEKRYLQNLWKDDVE